MNVVNNTNSQRMKIFRETIRKRVVSQQGRNDQYWENVGGEEGGRYRGVPNPMRPLSFQQTRNSWHLALLSIGCRIIKREELADVVYKSHLSI